MNNQQDQPTIWLEGLSLDYKGREFGITTDDFIMGRAPQCHLVLTEKTVSAQHAKISTKENQWYLSDLNSTNGTLLDGKKIAAVKIHSGDIIKIESVEFKFLNISEISLLGITVPYQDLKFYSNKEELTIGRAPQCHLKLEEKTISAEHAKIFKKGAQWYLKDLNSTNGTLLNGEKIQEEALRSGDIINIESIEFKYQNPLDVERTIIPKTAIPPTIVKDQKDGEPAAKEKVSTAKMPAEKKAIPVSHPPPRFGQGLFLGLLFALLFNIFIPYIVALLQTPKITPQSLYLLFVTIVSGFSTLHLPTHWVQFFSLDAFTIIVLIVLPLGIMGGGFIMQKTGPKNRLGAALSFSGSFLIITLIMQLLVARLNLTQMLNFYNASGMGINNTIHNFLAALGLFFVVVFIFSLLGSLFAKSK